MSDPMQFDGLTPRLALPLLYAAQAQKEFTVNEALTRLDFLAQCVIEAEVNSPPANPVDGQAWLVGSDPIGDFSARTGHMAAWTASGWRFSAPFPGMRVFDLDMQVFRHFSDVWSLPAEPVAASGGNTVDAEARMLLVSLIDTLKGAGIITSA